MSLHLACQDASFLGQMLACLSYGGVSVSITMFNKAVFSLYGFNYPNFVTTLQILVSILYMAILGCLGWFKFSRFKLRAARQVTLRLQVLSPWLPLSWAGRGSRSAAESCALCKVDASCQGCSRGLLYLPYYVCSAAAAVQMMPLVLFWWLYVVSGVTALRYLTVPMFRCALASAQVLLLLASLYVRPALHTVARAVLTLCCLSLQRLPAQHDAHCGGWRVSAVQKAAHNGGNGA